MTSETVVTYVYWLITILIVVLYIGFVLGGGYK